MSEQEDHACQGFKCDYVRVERGSLSVGKVSLSELWEQGCQNCQSEHVRGVRARLLESWESECVLVRVDQVGM